MSRQKQEQEGMLQSIAAGRSLFVFRLSRICGLINGTFLHTELSNEIRGERLRFIEAMKEATAINIGGASFSIYASQRTQH